MRLCVAVFGACVCNVCVCCCCVCVSVALLCCMRFSVVVHCLCVCVCSVISVGLLPVGSGVLHTICCYCLWRRSVIVCALV